MSSGVSSPSRRAAWQFAFKVIKSDLADNGVDHILDFARQHHLALDRCFGRVEHLSEREHFAKDTCCFGQCQGRG